MSVQALTHVWSRSPNKLGTLLVELALADYSNDEGLCFPSIETLCFKTRLSERQVHRVINLLEKKYKTLIVHKNKGPNGVNLYQLNYRHLPPRKKGGDNLSGVPFDASDGVPNTAQGVPSMTQIPALNGTQTVREPSLRTVIKKGKGEIEKSPFKPGELPPPPKPPQHVIDRWKSQDEAVQS